MLDKETIPMKWNLKKVNKLEEIIESSSFLIDLDYRDPDCFPIYPVTKKANLTHDLLNLYGTHWRYFIFESEKEIPSDLEYCIPTLKDIKDFKDRELISTINLFLLNYKLTKEDGDTKKVFYRLKNNIKEKDFAKYAFTKNNLEKRNQFYLFQEDTVGWDIFQNIIIPIYKKDLEQYNQKKKEIKSKK